jgi:hypothetical protein
MFSRNANLPQSVLLTCFLISLLAVQEGRACLCFSEPICDQMPDANGRQRVFVGTVADIFPASLDSYGGRESAFDENDPAWLARHKEAIFRVWGSVLSTSEARRVGLADTSDQMRRAADISMYARRVRFRVKEWLAGNDGEEFELFTESTSCGYSFHVGGEYLVVSEKHAETNRWWTGACSRTALVESVEAHEDLRTLRASKDGRPLPPRIYGQILDWRQRQPGNQVSPGLSGAVIRLVGASIDREIGSDEQGRFTFDDLTAASHRLQITSPTAFGLPHKIDLSHGGCFEAVVFIEQDAAGIEYKILGSGAPRKDKGASSTPE